jgi:agmatine/peptidylarginine deiminase
MLWLVVACAFGAILLIWRCAQPSRGSIVAVNDVAVRGVLPGDFESQERLILCWDEDVSRLAVELDIDNPSRTALSVAVKAAQHAVLIDIVKSTWNRLPITILVQHDGSRKQALAAVRQAGVPKGAVEVTEVPFDTVWVRNYGPFGVRRSKHDQATQPLWVLADNDLNQRDQDNRFASLLAESYHVPTMEIPLYLSGNVLSNGDGLLVTTEHLAEMNYQRGYSRTQLCRILRECFGAEQVVFLEDPRKAPNTDVDLFCVFTTADTILIGEHAADDDRIDAAIYDRGARLLERVRTRNGPLKVLRIPMPAGQHYDSWGGTFTNVVFANGVLLVPTYGGTDATLQERAFDLFRRALPDWQIVGIDCGPIRNMGGGLHCITMPIVQWPTAARGHMLH